MFGRLGTWCCRRRWVVLAAWILVILIGGGISGAVGSGFKSEFNLPDVESKHGMDILKAKFEGDGAGSSGTIVFQSKDGFDDAEKAQLQTFLNGVAKVDSTTVQSPFGPGGGQQISARDGTEGTIAYARIEVPRQLDQEEGKAYAEAVQKLQPHIDGVRIEYGGQMFVEFEPPNSEMLGLAFAIVILIAAFGSVLAIGFLGEEPRLFHVVGYALVLLGIFIAARK